MLLRRDWRKERVARLKPSPARAPISSGGQRVANVKVVLRLLCGESVDALSREVGEPTYKLEQWRDRALAGLEAGLKQRESDPVERELDEAKRRIGELVMEVEILQKERQRQVWLNPPKEHYNGQADLKRAA